MAMRAAACLSGVLARQRARQVRASISHYHQCSLKHVFVRADRDTHHRHLSFVHDADMDASKERNPLHRRAMAFRWKCYGLDGVNHNVNGL